MIENQMKEVIGVLEMIKEDMSVPKNVKGRIDTTINSLNSRCEVSIRVDQALQELGEISNDPNIPAYTRVEILNIISLLSTD
ncbi:UPF0147 family protein [Candidatus Woesearchaeota archaeon]|nr:UPF0147 family protein [Candidatus Woesearchaeota archaeon]